MKAHIKANVLQWHRDQRERALANAKADPANPDHMRAAKRHAATIKELTE
jgi:hypothetical protein